MKWRYIIVVFFILSNIRCVCSQTIFVDSIQKLNNKLDNWIKKTVVSFYPDSLVTATQNPDYFDIEVMDTSGGVGFIQLNDLIMLDSVIIIDSAFVIQFSIEPFKRGFSLFGFETPGEMIMNILYKSTINNNNTILRLLVKTCFIYDISMKKMTIEILQPKERVGAIISWNDSLQIKEKYMNLFSINGMPRLDWLLGGVCCNQTVLNVSVERKSRSPIFFRSNIESKYSQYIEEYFDWKYKDKYRNKYLKTDDQYRIKLAAVQGEVSGQSNVWENVEITIIANNIDGELVVICMIDGQWEEGMASGSGPTIDAISEGHNLENKYEPQMKNYAVCLVDEFIKLLEYKITHDEK